MKKLTQNVILEKLEEKGIKIFSILEFQRIFDINYESAKKILLRYTQKGIFNKAKKGLYFLAKNPPTEFEIANRLYQPSYISFETALSFYGIIPETIYQIISAAPNISRNFVINNLKFSYKKIKKECFLGYIPQKVKDKIILIAQPEKALTDFLYLVVLGKRDLSYERINLKKIKKQKLFQYGKCFKNKKLLNLLKELYD